MFNLWLSYVWENIKKLRHVQWWQKSRSLNHIKSVTRLFIMPWNLMCVCVIIMYMLNVTDSFCFLHILTRSKRRKYISHKYPLYSSSWLNFIFICISLLLLLFSLFSLCFHFFTGCVWLMVDSADMDIHCCRLNVHRVHWKFCSFFQLFLIENDNKIKVFFCSQISTPKASK